MVKSVSGVIVILSPYPEFVSLAGLAVKLVYGAVQFAIVIKLSSGIVYQPKIRGTGAGEKPLHAPMTQTLKDLRGW